MFVSGINKSIKNIEKKNHRNKINKKIKNIISINNKKTSPISNDIIKDFLNKNLNTYKILSDMKLYTKYINNYFDKIYSTYNKKYNISDIKNIIKLLDDKYYKPYNIDKNIRLSYKLFELTILKNYTIKINKRDKIKIENTEKDRRYNDIYTMYKKTLFFLKKNKIKVPETTVYIFMSDRYLYELDIENIKFPFFTIATPNNKYYPLIPDNTFECFSFKKRFGEECLDWDDSKKIIKKNLKNIESNKLYFKGKNTSDKRTNIRKYFEQYQNKDTMKISLEPSKNYEPMYNFSKYKYLLDLPGNYEWSNRFPRLFLMNRVVFKVTNTVKEYDEGNFITFTDLFTRKNKHYIELNDVLTDENKDENIPIIKKNIKKIDKYMDKLNKDDKKYKRISNSGYKLMNELSNKHIYIYIYISLLYNKKYFDGNTIRITR